MREAASVAVMGGQEGFELNTWRQEVTPAGLQLAHPLH